MKKLTNISMSKILLTCGVGLITTLAGFGHYQINQNRLSTIHVMNQGLGTCFGRINQSFTAMMIKDVKSPYLDQGFTQLTNACLDELKSTFKPLENSMPKIAEGLNRLNSEATWFHEKLGKIHSPMLLGQGMDGNLSPIRERYVGIEDLRVSLSDELDGGMHRLKQIQFSDEVIMGTGLLLFVIGLGLMSAQEVARMRRRTSAEKIAIGLIKNNQTDVGAMVDALVSKALTDQGLVVTAQIFKDYHESLLEGLHKQVLDNDLEVIPDHRIVKTEEKITVEQKPSLIDVINALKVINLDFEAREIADVEVKVEAEELTQLMSLALHKLNERRNGSHRVQVTSEINNDKCLVKLNLSSSAFNSEELEAFDNPSKLSDPTLMIISEMIKSTEITFNYCNQIDETTNQLGMMMSFVFPREPKAKNLISVVKGKKRDIARSLNN